MRRDPLTGAGYCRAVDGTTPVPVGGHREVDESASTLSFIGIVAALILLFLLYLARSNAVIVIILMLLLGCAVGLAAWSIREMRRWHPIEVVFTHWPPALGSSQPVRIHRVAKTRVPDAQVAVTGELICTEKVTYSVGTDTRTDTARPAELSIAGSGALVAGRLDADFELVIPVDRGAPTMDLPNNEISWELKLDITNPHGADKRMTIAVPVAAVLARRHQDIQDAPPEPGR